MLDRPVFSKRSVEREEHDVAATRAQGTPQDVTRRVDGETLRDADRFHGESSPTQRRHDPLPALEGDFVLG
jgi:hypothetical protein